MKKRIKKILDPDFKKQIDKILSDFKLSLYDLHDVATRDDKTGLYNNRFFMNIFEIEIDKAWRNKQKLSLVVIDIDFLKKFNDTYGHLVGDEILLELAVTLQTVLRKYDILARFGGEEFFVLLPETGIKLAKRVSERLRTSLLKNKKMNKYEVTISLGVTEYKDKDTMERMIKRADKALYVSKKEGRNMVSVL
ncbi:MAG: GGDEF domain-containing protein [Nanoarchaeota archaeon]|nr:GGDEF domain-containing protein [Nanoarchaeota archaeon]